MIAAAVTAAVVGAVGLVPGTADAATNPYTAAQVCGSGYTQLHRLTLKTAWGSVFGYTYLFYSAAEGKNCAVTLKTSYVGKTTMTGVTIDVIDGRESSDKQNYEYYADTKISARHQCVQYNGFIYSEPNYGGTWAGAAYGHFDWCD